MSVLSVRVNGVQSGSQKLDSAQLYPLHQERIQQILSKTFSHLNIPTGPKEIPFEVHLRPGAAVLCMGGKEISLAGAKFKDVERAVQYYQHTGHLERRVEDSAKVEAEVKKSVEAMCTASIPGANGKVISGMHVTEDTIALLRSIIFSISPLGTEDPIGIHLGYYTGVLGAFFAFRECDLGIDELRRANAIGDSEGKRRAKARLLSGGIVSGASSAYLVEKLLSPVLTPLASACLTVASESLFALGSFLNLGVSSLGALRCYRFNHRLNEYLDNDGLSVEQKLRGALQFLKDQMCVTVEEKEQILAKIEKEHPTLSEAEKNALFNQAIQNKVETKVKFLKRRTSNKSLYLILTRVSKVLDKLNKPETRLEGIRDASLLIDQIQKENKTKFTLYALGVLAAVLGILGMTLFIFCPPLAALPFILYGIAGTIYLGMTVYTTINVFRQKKLNHEYNFHALSDIGVHMGSESHAHI